ncbi:MAG: CPBP family intramembrane metalloprotease, partial [Propionibacteriaceae bacterium]|nr:CPBP family intramembrane metalloprotease [Propionibacteriaceae bacterium]
MSKQPVTPRLPLFQPTELRDQMRFFQVPARGWAWGLLALLLAAALVFAAMLIGNVAMMLDPAFAASLFETGASGSLTDVTSALVMTPAVFLINNLSIAAFIPVAVLASWLIYKQGFGWLSSVVGRFRWRWWGMALAVFAIGYAIYYAIQLALFGPQSFFGDMSWRSSSLVLIIGIVLTTPLQCAGEEFLVRGLVARSIAAIIRPRLIGLAASAIGSSLLFMWLHSAADVWLNSYYTCVGLMLWWLVWRTGGLEAAVAFHIINNLMSEINVPFTDISQMMDRSAGQGSPWILLDLGVQLILVLL